MTPQEFERLYFNKNAGPLTLEDFKRLGISELWVKWDEQIQEDIYYDFDRLIDDTKKNFQKKQKDNGKS